MGLVPVNLGYPEVMKMSASTARKKSRVRGWSESKLFTRDFSLLPADAGAGMRAILSENDLTRGRTEHSRNRVKSFGVQGHEQTSGKNSVDRHSQRRW